MVTRLRQSIAFPALLTLLAIAGCADEASDETDDSQDAIVGGQPENGNEYDAVVAIYDTRDNKLAGSGVFIAPGVVVTAEHVFDGRFASDVEVRRGPDSERPTRRYEVKSVEEVVAEGKESVVGYGADVAFLILKEPATNVTPLPMLDRSLDDTDLNRATRLIGYGQTQARIEDSNIGRRRHGAPGVVTAVRGRPHANALVPGTTPPTRGPELRYGYEAQIEDTDQGINCVGDWGGPHLAQVNGVLTVMALSSAQSLHNKRCTPSFTIVSSFGFEVQAAKARALEAASR